MKSSMIIITLLSAFAVTAIKSEKPDCAGACGWFEGCTDECVKDYSQPCKGPPGVTDFICVPKNKTNSFRGTENKETPQHLGKFSWPVWANESEAIGTSSGPFPFWCDTANQTKGAYKFLCLDREKSYQEKHRTRMLYSYSRMTQITYRDNCDLTHFGGDAGVQCAHRFMPDGTAFITYEGKDGNEDFCCQSFGHLPQSNPLPIPHPEFMNTCLDKKGPMPYNGTYYQGMVYNYTDEFAELPTYFWYLTAVDEEKGEWPVEQGEGCVIDWKRRGECTAAGKVSKLGPKIGDPPPIKFEYEQFYETVFADSEFELPAICKSDKLKECYNMECDSGAPPSQIDPTFKRYFLG